MDVQMKVDKAKPAEPVPWVFVSGLGERDSANVTDQDMLTSLKFDKTGDYLALGDKAGRVIVF
jgi:serine/threonine-protein phosphatase 2A regulatory subunit B